MRPAVGVILALVGGSILLYGVTTGLAELVGLYGRTLSDPLAGGAPEADASAGMLRAAMIGAIGAAPFLVGVFMLKAALIRRVAGAARQRPPRHGR